MKLDGQNIKMNSKYWVKAGVNLDMYLRLGWTEEVRIYYTGKYKHIVKITIKIMKTITVTKKTSYKLIKCLVLVVLLLISVFPSSFSWSSSSWWTLTNCTSRSGIILFMCSSKPCSRYPSSYVFYLALTSHIFSACVNLHFGVIFRKVWIFFSSGFVWFLFRV